MSTTPKKRKIAAYAPVAKTIRDARRARFSSAKAFGKRVGMCRETISQIENCYAIPTDRDSTYRIAAALDLDCDELWAQIVDLRTPSEKREVWEQRLQSASMAPADIAPIERVLLLSLRRLGEQLGRPTSLTEMLAEMIAGWEWSARPEVARAVGGTPGEPAAGKALGIVGTLRLVRMMGRNARDGFVRSVDQLARAFVRGQMHTDPAAYDVAFAEMADWMASRIGVPTPPIPAFEVLGDTYDPPEAPPRREPPPLEAAQVRRKRRAGGPD